jgi:hypothetical protein
MRSLSWNSCIPVIEAGIEEAMTHINVSGITNLNQAGWSLGATGYTKTRYLGSNYYTVTISLADPPTVVSEGHVPLPLNPAGALGFLAAVGVNTTQVSGRKVQVATRKDGMWTMAMVAKGQIDLMGNNVMSDSFDSADPNYSTNGQYDVNKHKAHGDIGTNSTITNSLNVADANIWGMGKTGPGGSVDIGPNGAIGDINWQTTTKRGIEPGFVRNDMSIYLRDIKLPYTGGGTPIPGLVGSSTATYLLTGTSGLGNVVGSGDYVMTDLSLQGNQFMYVSGNCRLVVTGSINISGNAYIEIANGGSLELFMAGASASLGGNGVVNDGGYAINFLYFGLPTNTSLSFAGNGTFIGAIYAPEATFTLGGGGGNNQDFIGASVSNTVKMNGHFNFHYDEALGRSGWARGYVISSWNEI